MMHSWPTKEQYKRMDIRVQIRYGLFMLIRDGCDARNEIASNISAGYISIYSFEE